jgi:hypothetical protein
MEANSQCGNIPGGFIEIDSNPNVLKCYNELEVNNQGGHLQGVQLLVKNEAEYVVLSGSSDTYAYYSVIKKENGNEVQSVNLLMHKPFKHAGGIQVFENLMVVGIEDNDAKDKSKVCIYTIGNPEQPSSEPLAMIERSGAPYRSTAGCSGITKIGERYLVVVGDWNTEHLDFYISNDQWPKQKLGAFDKVSTIDTEKIDKSDWHDMEWHAYQNINLLRDAGGKLYLFGFGRNDRNENIADLFLVENKDFKEFRLQKINSRTFYCKEGADFRAGAGIFIHSSGKLKIISCSSHINDSLVLNVFD